MNDNCLYPSISLSDCLYGHFSLFRLSATFLVILRLCISTNRRSLSPIDFVYQRTAIYFIAPRVFNGRPVTPSSPQLCTFCVVLSACLLRAYSTDVPIDRPPADVRLIMRIV